MTIKHSNWSNNMEEPMKELEKGRKISKKKSQKKRIEKSGRVRKMKDI